MALEYLVSLYPLNTNLKMIDYSLLQKWINLDRFSVHIHDAVIMQKCVRLQNKLYQEIMAQLENED